MATTATSSTATVTIPVGEPYARTAGNKPGVYYFSTSQPYTNLPPNQWTNIPNHTHGTPSAIPYGSPFVSSPLPPQEGQTAFINGEVYRYSQAVDKWILVQSEENKETIEAPVLPVELDATALNTALKQYADFLNDLDGLDNTTAEIVDDVLFGLREAIEALDRLGTA